MLINSASLRTLGTGFSAAFQGGFSGVQPMYGRVAQTVPSSTSENEYGWLGKIPRIREWIGDRVIQNIGQYDYTIKNKSFESTIGVDRDHIEDDNIGIYTPLFGEFGRSAAVFPDELVWPLLKNGFAATCYDGQYYFDTDHPVLDENGVAQSVSNTGGGAGTPWFLIDAGRVIKPIIYQSRKPFSLVTMDKPDDEGVFNRKEFRYGLEGRCNVGFGFWQLAYGSKQALDAAAYSTARAAMMSQKADFGKPLGIVPTLLVVPPTLEGAGRKILNSEYATGGETNPWKGTAELMVVPWLA
ncbi:MAG TPA: Mu-like prophage major head subunit gpT family protein [Xanthobacteraceae bacterium]|nr:Mu-like prophage major head subunit gpT family protein [Xanthobacteraceae bacterium]